MELILISYPDFFAKESQIVSSLMEKYSFTFHLRKPNANPEEYALFLQRIPSCFHNRIVLHDAYGLQNEFKLKGIHASAKKRKSVQKTETAGSLSTSCHSVLELQQLENTFQYAFISPVFPSISKPGYKGKLNMKDLQDFLFTTRKLQVIALGGISKLSFHKLANYQFDGIAVLGAVWSNSPETHNKTIETNFKHLYQCIHQGHTV